ncbi:hypothetical protein P154DRAFT_367084 [Amniculicola lignicola CBS 123094]|uniref:Uncharacterized protein n=1 Tax=Amniculicola lignicola CBS 123094 TaxID=1392246 RepID=A0A6A5W0W0_9PLEO|nr:hypothetical protein P154DRAFT_367084 [Amniculicola lignicola CBS 123094]
MDYKIYMISKLYTRTRSAIPRTKAFTKLTNTQKALIQGYNTIRIVSSSSPTPPHFRQNIPPTPLHIQHTPPPRIPIPSTLPRSMSNRLITRRRPLRHLRPPTLTIPRHTLTPPLPFPLLGRLLTLTPRPPLLSPLPLSTPLPPQPRLPLLPFKHLQRLLPLPLLLLLHNFLRTETNTREDERRHCCNWTCATGSRLDVDVCLAEIEGGLELGLAAAFAAVAFGAAAAGVVGYCCGGGVGWVGCGDGDWGVMWFCGFTKGGVGIGVVVGVVGVVSRRSSVVWQDDDSVVSSATHLVSLYTKSIRGIVGKEVA